MFYSRALLPLVVNPVTYTHLRVVRDLVPNCGSLFILVHEDTTEVSLIPFPVRVTMLERAIAQDTTLDPYRARIQVLSSAELIPDVALRLGCDVVWGGDRPALEERHLSGGAYHMFKRENLYKWEDKSQTVLLFAKRHMGTSALTPMFVQSYLGRLLHQQMLMGVFFPPGGSASVVEAKKKLTSALALAFKTAKRGKHKFSAPPFHFLDMADYPHRLMHENCHGYEAFVAQLEKKEAQYAGKTFLWWRAQKDRLLRQDLDGKMGLILVGLDDVDFAPVVNNNLLVLDVEGETPFSQLGLLEQSVKFHQYGKILHEVLTSGTDYKAVAQRILTEMSQG